MLDPETIDRIAAGAATAVLGMPSVRAESRPSTDWEGEDILEIKLVLSPAALKKALEGDKALNMLVQISRDLQQRGEDRFPVLIWRTSRGRPMSRNG